MIVGRGDEVDAIELDHTPPAIAQLSKGLGSVTAVAISDDGKGVAAGFADGIIRIFSGADRDAQPVLLKIHSDLVRSLAFDLEGETLISVGDDGMIRSSIIGEDRLASVACGMLWRELNADEIKSYFGGFKPPPLPTCEGKAP